jgi:hypothetical protein
MKIFFWGIVFFSLVFIVHLLIWRIRVPKKQTQTLLALYACGAAAGGLVIPLLNQILPKALSVGSFAEILTIFVFYGSIALGYIAFYSLLESDSPTLTLIRGLTEAKSQGMTIEELYEMMSKKQFVRSRLEQLLKDGWVIRSGNTYCATQAGKGFLSIFNFQRRLFKLKSKGG